MYTKKYFIPGPTNCTKDDDCAIESVPECTSDTDCKDGQKCNGGKCATTGKSNKCINNDDYKKKIWVNTNYVLICLKHFKIEPIHCSKNDDCTMGEICEVGKCVQSTVPEFTSDAECKDGQKCNGGICATTGKSNKCINNGDYQN